MTIAILVKLVAARIHGDAIHGTRRSEGDNGNSDQLHLTKALEPKPVEFAFSFVRSIPHHARLGGGDHERQLLVSFEMFVVVKK